MSSAETVSVLFTGADEDRDRAQALLGQALAAARELVAPALERDVERLRTADRAAPASERR